MKETLQEFKSYLDEAKEKQARRAAQLQAEADEVPESVLTGLTRIALSAEGIVPEQSTTTTVTATADGDAEDSDSDDNDDEDECEDELDYTANEEIVVDAAVKLMGKALGCIKHTLFITTSVCDAVSSSVDGGAQPREVVEYCQQWMAQLAHLSQLLNKDVLNLGAELYPPFESDPSKITSYFEELRSHCRDYLLLVDSEVLRALQSAEHAAKIAELQQDVHACSLSI